ncbi:MAG TPA: RluA family pseudouridine synthase [Dissulfurispiraceae bacterium]|nr:RluA family pseudouridine synthase [Dissulfurispiraceae bacterium]
MRFKELSHSYKMTSNATQTIIAEQDSASQRLDLVAAKLFELSRSQAQKSIEAGELLVNNLPSTSNYRVRSGDVLAYAAPEVDEDILIPEDIPLSVLYEDPNLIVVDKPAGMVVYPAAGHARGTLMNALAHRCSQLAAVGGPLRPGVVHRLDKGTSGVMVVALDDGAYYHLVGQFQERNINRRYTAVVAGRLKQESGEIALSIGRSPQHRKKMSTRAHRRKPALTGWKTIERFPDATLIEAKLGTGRTHQIRVHFSAIGHPVLGDTVYGRKTMLERGRAKIAFPRQMLHAALLGFVHPVTGDYLEFSAPIPDDMAAVLAALRSA